MESTLRMSKQLEQDTPSRNDSDKWTIIISCGDGPRHFPFRPPRPMRTLLWETHLGNLEEALEASRVEHISLIIN